MTTDAARTRLPLPHRGRAWILGVALPVVTVAAAWIWFAVQYGHLPEVVATHWGTSGADGFGSRGNLVVGSAILTGLVLFAACPFAVLTGRQSTTRKMAVGIAAGAAVMTSGILVAVTRANLTQPPGDPGTMMLMAIAAGIVVGIAAGAAAGDDPIVRATEPVPADAPRARLSPTQRAVWVKETGFPLPAFVALVLVAVGMTALLALIGEPFVAVLLGLGLLALFAGMLRYHVRVDADGLTARSYLGFAMMRSRADEIVRADVTTVDALGEFGGWGLRVQPGTGVVGLVTRKGEAVRIERTGGRVQVVTVDDAAGAAALLNTMADRARPVARIEDTELGTLAGGTDPTSGLATRGPGTGSRRPTADADPRRPARPERGRPERD